MRTDDDGPRFIRKRPASAQAAAGEPSEPIRRAPATYTRVSLKRGRHGGEAAASARVAAASGQTRPAAESLPRAGGFIAADPPLAGPQPLRQLVDQRKRLRQAARARLGALTRRETQVLMLVAGGFSNKQIAIMLEISARTIEIHRAHMMTKLGARSTADAVRIAIYAGLDRGLPLFSLLD